MTNVIKFPGYNANPGPLAIPAQMTERMLEVKAAGRECHVVAMIAELHPSGRWSYHPYWDTQPRELMSYMASEIHRHAHTEEPDDPPGPVEA